MVLLKHGRQEHFMLFVLLGDTENSHFTSQIVTQYSNVGSFIPTFQHFGDLDSLFISKNDTMLNCPSDY